MADITLLTTSGDTWSTFGTWATTTNQVISRVNAIGTYDNVTITGGLIDGTTIGSTTPSLGTFTDVTINSSLTLTGAVLVLDSDSISGNSIYGGTITVDYVELNQTPTANNHATTKSYVDTEISTVRNEMIAYTLIFGN